MSRRIDRGSDAPRPTSRPSPAGRPPQAFPYRFVAMLFISLALVFVLLAVIRFIGNGDSGSGDPSAPASTTPSSAPASPPVGDTSPVGTSEAPGESPAPTPPAEVPPVPPVPVTVVNNSGIDGLAATTGDRVRAIGVEVANVGNLHTEVPVSRSTVFYGDAPGEKETAERVAGELGIAAAPRSEGPPELAENPGVVVVATRDLS